MAACHARYFWQCHIAGAMIPQAAREAIGRTEDFRGVICPIQDCDGDTRHWPPVPPMAVARPECWVRPTWIFGGSWSSMI